MMVSEYVPPGNEWQALIYKINRVIEAERARIGVLRETGSEEVLVASGRLQAWMAVAVYLSGIEDGLGRYE